MNDVEMTRLGAGMGMDPFDLLIPDNRLVATATPHQVGIARCECGEYGCDSTDVVITRDENAVHWDREVEAPIRGGVSFKADEYDAEVARVGTDTTWERPEDTTARLTLAGVDRERLASMDMRLDWVAKDQADHSLLKIALYLGSSDGNSDEAGYQVFLRFDWAGRTPQEAAAGALAAISRDPREWTASWHATKRGTAFPPAIAGPKWRQESTGIPVPEAAKRGRRFWRRTR